MSKSETFAKPSDVDAVQDVAAQRVQTYHIDRQTSEQRTTKKCAADGGFAKVSIFIMMLTIDQRIIFALQVPTHAKAV